MVAVMTTMQSDRGRPIHDELAHVDAALETWARWVHEGLSGWPTVTILARVAEQGFTGAAQRGPTPEMPETILATERAVLALKAIERQVVVKHYVHWQPVEVSARYCHMSANRFRVLLHRARHHIRASLEQAGREL
jgi:DNA-directed RNA polymerase specialized sigma24 family protein